MAEVNELWTERYRPATIDDYVFKDSNQKAQIMEWINKKSIPHLLFSGSAGIGKTTLAKILINALEIDQFDLLLVNGSRENGVDYFRDTIKNFAQTMPFGDLKIVLIDECLDENTKVVVKRGGVDMLLAIKDVNATSDLVKSFNVTTDQVEWKPFELFDKGVQDTLTIEFENGEVVVCTPSHKWYVEINGIPTIVTADELHKHNHILTVL